MQGGRIVFRERSNISIASEIQDYRSTKPIMDTVQNTTPIDSDAHMLSVPFYFTSPLTTLLESLHDPDCTQVSLYDIMEAYDCFSDRIRSVANVLMCAEGTPRSLRIIQENSSRLVVALKRDLQRPFSVPSPQSQNSSNLYPYIAQPTISDDDVQYAVDSSMLAQRALCFISDVCIFRPLYSLFSASEIHSIMDDVFAYTVSCDSTIMNESKLCTLIVWILQTQQLPVEMLVERQKDIFMTVSSAVKGNFGLLAVTDGLKAIHSLLTRHGRSFLAHFVPLLPDVLKYTVNDSLDLRLESMYALSGFASATRQSENESETCSSVRRAVHAFIEDQHKKRKDAPSGIFLAKIVEGAISIVKPCHFGSSPSWAVNFISSLIAIFDYSLFFRPHCVQLVFSTLFSCGHHKRSAVRALHPHIWRLLIWAYLRIPTSVDTEEFGNVDVADVRKRTFKVISQDIKNDIGIALVASLLHDDPTLVSDCAFADGIENALLLVRDMICSTDDLIRQNGLDMLRRLYGLREEENPIKRPTDRLVFEKLFDASLLNVKIEGLSTIIQPIPSFSPNAVRQLTNGEIYNHWGPIVSVWITAARQSLKASDPQLSDELLSAWISLLEIFVQRCDSLTPTSSPTGLSNSVVMIAGELLDISDQPHEQVRHLVFVERMWTITKNVLYDTWLPSNAEIILAVVLKRNFILEDEGVRKAWRELCTQLISVGVPTLMHVVYFQSEKMEKVQVIRQLWNVLAKTWQVIDHGTTWDDLVTLLVVPFRAWKFSTQEFEQWDSILRNAVRLADTSSASETAVVRLFFERLGNNRLEAFKENPRALCSVLRYVNISGCQELDRKLFELVDETLSGFYPPLPELLATCIDLVCVLGELIATCPDNLLLELVKSIQHCASIWIQDEKGVLLGTEQNIIVNAVYCNALERLSHHEPTFEMLHNLAPFLVSVFKAQHIPDPALGPTCFEKFWRMTYHGKDLERLYPDDVKACIKSLSLVWGGSIANDLTISDSQKSLSIVSDSQTTPQIRRRSEQPQTPLSSPFDVFLSPRRRSSAPPSPHLVSRVSNARSPEISTTPRNRLSSSFRHTQAEASRDSWTPTRHSYASEDVVLRKSNKRILPTEHDRSPKRQRVEVARRRRSGNSPPQHVLSDVHKFVSEPLPGIQPSMVNENRSQSQPSPQRKRKLFDYADLSHLRNVRRRTSIEESSILEQYQEPLLFQPEDDSEDRLYRQDQRKGKEKRYRRCSSFLDPANNAILIPSTAVHSPKGKESADAPHISEEPGNDHEERAEELIRCQSLPVVVKDSEQPTSVQRPPVRRHQSAWERLEAIEHAYAAVADADGASQVPVDDLMQASRLVNQMAVAISDMMSRKLVRSGSTLK